MLVLSYVKTAESTCAGFVRHLLKNAAYMQCLLKADRANSDAKGTFNMDQKDVLCCEYLFAQKAQHLRQLSKE